MKTSQGEVKKTTLEACSWVLGRVALPSFGFLLLGLLINGDCQYSLLRWLCLQEINQIQVNVYLFNNHHYGLGNMRESLG